ncbi:MAG: peptidase dimerization domain-containing protein, partial [Deltaproteobacteria bacterium]|nr:peptidase dimerization domain-containing protein [Deltaproteobacteria bacterium]
IAGKPELGFKETETAEFIRAAFAGLGLPTRTGIAVTGVEGLMEGARPGPGLFFMGEMDAVVNRESSAADPVTGAAHLCGHHLQVGIMLGAAVGLIRANARDLLSGKVFFLGTPAEEFIEIEERLRMREQGKIHYLGGKQELVRLGYLKDKQLCVLVHAHSGLSQRKMLFGGRSNGFLAKSIRFHGKPAHAGVSPHEGINALNAACLAILNIHAQRETFREDDKIRVHPIITRGGDVVNVVPYDVRMETYVRGARVEAITDANAKVDRALRAGADAVGAKVAIQNIPGYLPLIQNPAMSEIAKVNAISLAGEEGAGAGGFEGGSTDMGDLSYLIPTIQPYSGGIRGNVHAADFEVADYEAAVIYPAKVMAMTVIDLLFGGAEEARRVIGEFKPEMTTDEYLAFLQKIEKTE